MLALGKNYFQLEPKINVINQHGIYNTHAIGRKLLSTFQLYYGVKCILLYLLIYIFTFSPWVS